MTDNLELRGDSSSLNSALDSAVKAFQRYVDGVDRITKASVSQAQGSKRLEGSISGIVGKNRELTVSFEQVGNKYKIVGQTLSQVANQQIQDVARIAAAETAKERQLTQAHNLRMQQLRAEQTTPRTKGKQAGAREEDTKLERAQISLAKEQIRLEIEKQKAIQVSARVKLTAAQQELAVTKQQLELALQQERAEERKHQKSLRTSRARQAGAERKAASQRQDLALESQREGRLQRNRIAFEQLNASETRARQRAVIDLQRIAVQQQRVNNAVNQGAAGVQKMTISFNGLARILLVTTAYRAFFAFVNTIREGVSSAIEFQRAVAGVQTISQRSALTTKEWADGLQRVSDGWRLDILEQTEAAYQTLTNQVAQGAEVFGFLEEANRFATAAFVETNEAVRLGAAAINAMGIDVSEASSIFASFFKTIELGRLRGGELTEIGRILLPAKQLGVELNEVQAAMSTLTIQGVKANEAMTFLRGIFQKLIRPTQAMKRFYDELGVSTGQAAIQTLGFEGFLLKLEERFSGSADELGELFNRVRALAGIFGLSGSALEKFGSNLEEIRGSTEAYNKAVELVQSTSGEKLAIQMSRLTNIFIRAGESFLDTASDMTNGFSFIEGAARNIVLVVRSLLVPALTVATAGFGLLAKSMLATPFGQVLALMTAVTTAFTYLVTATERADEKIRASLAQSQREQLEATRDRVDAEVRAREESRRTLTLAFQGVRQNIAQTVALTNTVFTLQTRVLDKTLESVKDLGNVIKSTISDSISNTETAIRDLAKVGEDALREVDALQRGVGRTIFDWELEEKNGQEALDFIRNRIRQLEDEVDILGPDQFDLAKSLQAESRTLVAQYRRLQDQIIKENQRTEEERAKLATKFHEDRMKLLKDINALETQLREQGSSDIKKRADIENDLLEKRTELNKLVTETSTAANRLALVAIQERDTIADIIKLRDRQAAQLQRIAAEAEALAEAEKQRLARQVAQQASFERLFKTISDARVKDILDLDSPELIEKALNNQATAAQRLINLARELGIEYKDIEAVVDSVVATEGAVRIQQQRESIKQLQQLNELEEKRTLELRKQAEQERSNAERRIQTFREELTNVARAVRGSAADRGSSLFQQIYGEQAEETRRNLSGRDILPVARVRAQTREELIAIAESLERFAQLQGAELLDGVNQEFETLSATVARLEQSLGDIAGASFRTLRESLQRSGGMMVPGQGPQAMLTVLESAILERQRLDKLISDSQEQALLGIREYKGEAQTVNDALTAALQEQYRIQRDTNNSQEVRLQAAEKIREIEDELIDLQIEQGAALGEVKSATEVRLSLEEQIEDSLRRQRDTLRELSKLKSEVPALQQQATGLRRQLDNLLVDPQGFANGGSVGQDKIRAMLSPGEFVVNPKAASNMYSQLVGMNSGFNNQASSAGTTINGDFNINVTSTGNNKVDAIGIGRALRSEIRRGTVRLK